MVGDAVNREWSPDGRRITFELDRPTGEPVCSIMLIKSDGSGLTDLTGQTNGCEAQPAFTPDGFGQALYTSGIDGSKLNQLTPFSFDVAVKHDWAPDGKRLVMTVNADFPSPRDSANIATIVPDGTGLRYLTDFTYGLVNPFVGSYSSGGRSCSDSRTTPAAAST